MAGLLNQGITPRKLALTLTIGVLVGIVPVMGVSTAICFLLALVLRLNHIGIQAVQYAVYPLQLISLVPFYKFGGFIFNKKMEEYSSFNLLNLFSDHWYEEFIIVLQSAKFALIGWIIICIPLSILIYHSGLIFFKRYKIVNVGTEGVT